MPSVEELVKGRNPNQYFSSIYANATPSLSSVNPSSTATISSVNITVANGTGGAGNVQRTSNNKRKRINYNISALQQSNEQQQHQEQLSRQDSTPTPSGGTTTNVALIEQQEYEASELDRLTQMEQRKALRRFEELNRENYNDQSKFELPKSFNSLTSTSNIPLTVSGGNANSTNKTKPSVAVKRIMNSKKNWNNYLDELDKTELRYLKTGIEVKNDQVQVRKLCTICGNTSCISCIKCKARVCCLKCQTTHNETRCTNF